MFGVYTRTVVLPIIGVVMSTTAEVALTLDADVAGGRLYGWHYIFPDLLRLCRHDGTMHTLLPSVVWNI